MAPASDTDARYRDLLEEIDRLRVFAEAWPRMLMSSQRAMVLQRPLEEPASDDSLLSDFTRQVLAEARAVQPTLPDGWDVTVSATSDVILAHRGAGQWVGIRMAGIGEHHRWEAWRGSRSIGVPDRNSWPTLAAAVAEFAR
jgi:hypothetical protein